MSGFGGSNPFTGGNSGGRSNSGSWGGGGRHNSRGGGRSSGRGRSGGRSHGGRSGGRGRSGGWGGRGRPYISDNLPIKLHAQLNASSKNYDNNNNNNSGYNNNNQSNYNPFHPVNSVAIWDTGGNVKIFTGGNDGYWRLWSFNNQTKAFDKESEHQMGGPVGSLVVASNFLFCGFEGITKALPEVTVGMIHAWNLASPNEPPLEFHVHPLIPYAHSTAVKTLTVVEGQKFVSGSKDGSIRLWAFEQGRFALTRNIVGHARDITGLVDVGPLLWSCSVDGAIRIWDMAKPDAPCQHCISSVEVQQNPSQPNGNKGPGHTNAVTGLVKFTSASASKDFVLSCSLDGTVKAWDGTNGQCVFSENHPEGVVAMSMIGDANGKTCLLLGCESGTMYLRNLEPTPKIQQAFTTIGQLDSNNSNLHNGAVRSACQGPTGTFYTSGDDGKVFVCQITGDLGL